MVKLAEFFRPLAMSLAPDARIEPSEVLTRVIVPPLAPGTNRSPGSP